jgi:hypothetical protein
MGLYASAPRMAPYLIDAVAYHMVAVAAAAAGLVRTAASWAYTPQRHAWHPT